MLARQFEEGDPAGCGILAVGMEWVKDERDAIDGVRDELDPLKEELNIGRVECPRGWAKADEEGASGVDEIGCWRCSCCCGKIGLSLCQEVGRVGAPLGPGVFGYEDATCLRLDANGSELPLSLLFAFDALSPCARRWIGRRGGGAAEGDGRPGTAGAGKVEAHGSETLRV